MVRAFWRQMQASGNPGRFQLGQVLGQRCQERVAARAIHGAHAP